MEKKIKMYLNELMEIKKREVKGSLQACESLENTAKSINKELYELGDEFYTLYLKAKNRIDNNMKDIKELEKILKEI